MRTTAKKRVLKQVEAIIPKRGIEYARKIRNLLSARTPGQATVAIGMGPEALVVRDAFHDEIEPRLKPGSGDLAAPGLKEWSRKLVGTMARLAGNDSRSKWNSPMPSARVARQACG